MPMPTEMPSIVSRLEAQPPWCIDIDNIDVQFLFGRPKSTGNRHDPPCVDNVRPDFIDGLLYSIVGLSETSDPSSPCLGCALVRSVHKSTLFLLTDCPPSLLSRVTSLQVYPHPPLLDSAVKSATSIAASVQGGDPMAFLKRLICGCVPGKVKYEDAPEEPKKGIKRRLPCVRWKCKAKTVPASSVEDSESNDNQHPTEEIPTSPDVTSPVVSLRNKHSKSYSSVSSMGRRLVERLADEVVEDFMGVELMSHMVSPTSLPSPCHFETPEEETPMETMTDSAIEDVQKTVETQRILSAEIRRSSEDVLDGSMEGMEGEDLVDSASENRVGSIRSRRAFFEQYSVSTKVDEIKGTADMKPTPELEMDQRNRRSHPTPIRITDRGGDVTIVSRILERVASGQSWILEDAKQTLKLDRRLLDVEFGSRVQSKGETCVVRRVFHASSLADDENDSSDGSVISVEIDSDPRDNDDDHRCSLAWMPRARGQTTYQ